MTKSQSASAKTERERRDQGLWYDANNDPELLAERLRARELAYDFNHARPGEGARQREILERLLGHVGERVTVLAPLLVDCGYLVSIGDDSFVNYGTYFMDGARIAVGRHVYIGPNCGLYTAQHPLVPAERNRGLERALPVTIEDDCWLGGDVKVLPGVTIGRGSTIGAGSVVTRDVPPGVVAAGNPCRVLRKITAADSVG